ncbi:hypothetical protein ES703_116540 [subsurface metagenome]
MFKKDFKKEKRKKLLNDNLTVKKRIDKLFPSLTGIKWKEAVKKIYKHDQLNYVDITEFCQSAAKARNHFLHEGLKHAIPKDMPRQCIAHISPLINLFVSLHNGYIANSINEDSKVDTFRNL